MGYDFCFFSLKPQLDLLFPCGFDETPNEPGPISWSTLRQRILARGARENGSADCLWLDFGDDNSIVVNGRADGISLDVHAEWNFVLELYMDFLPFEPGLVICDLQEGCYHDEKSFRQFMIESGYPPPPNQALERTDSAE